MFQFISSSLTGRVMEAANHSKNSAMEAENHVKHGASSKSLTSRRKAINLLVVMTVLCISFNFVSAQENQENPHFKRKSFGLDVGFGMSTLEDRSSDAGMIGIGVRWLRNFNPYVGWEWLNLKAHLAPSLPSVDGQGNWDTGGFDLQLMTGIRGNSPALFGNISAYSALRFGSGATFSSDRESWNIRSCYELEFGLNLTPTVFAGFLFNRQNASFTDNKGIYFDYLRNFAALRLGFNFGKLQEYAPVGSDEGWFVDLGIGGTRSASIVNGKKSKHSGTAHVDFGFSYLKKYHEYVGWEIIKIKALKDLKEPEGTTEFLPYDRLYPQILTGVRGFSPAFYSEMSGYAAFRPGVGFHLTPDFKVAFAYELELGVHLTKSMYAGFAFNSLMRSETIEVGSGMDDMNVKSRIYYSALRVGFKW